MQFSDVLKKDDASRCEIEFSKCKNCDRDIEDTQDNDTSSSESTDANEEGSIIQDFISVEEISKDDESEYVPADRIPHANPAATRRSNRSNKGVPPHRYVATAKLVKEKPDLGTVDEALSRPNKDDWKKAMHEEIESLIKKTHAD